VGDLPPLGSSRSVEKSLLALGFTFSSKDSEASSMSNATARKWSKNFDERPHHTRAVNGENVM